MNLASRASSHVRALTALAAVAALAIGGCGSSSNGNPDSRLTEQQAKAPISGAPPQLATIRAQANQLLDGGPDAFDARLVQLRGTPVVVNKWASWCGPCRFEFPWFQSLAEKRGGQIAFLGVNSNDSSGSADTFLSELPLPYPSYSDPDLKIAQDLGGPPQAFPTTTYYDRSGKQVFTHPGVYGSEGDLVADVNKYAAGG
ncbi:MAG TPA: TlpA disulfide reductase family protein [Solirubrobacterales bacterium]|nr:TlpA disulfide reductase family protein [Solirubrobacterales bacterium]